MRAFIILICFIAKRSSHYVYRSCLLAKLMTRFSSGSPSLPALDWQLPSSSGPYSLQIEMQPKSHHRAHYETEGSRGAVKAPAGGHPVVRVCEMVFLIVQS